MKNQKKLKPVKCVCGRKAELLFDEDIAEDIRMVRNIYYVKCTRRDHLGCNICWEGPVRFTATNAIKAWNKLMERK